MIPPIKIYVRSSIFGDRGAFPYSIFLDVSGLRRYAKRYGLRKHDIEALRSYRIHVV